MIWTSQRDGQYACGNWFVGILRARRWHTLRVMKCTSKPGYHLQNRSWCQRNEYSAAAIHSSEFRQSMKSADNPLEESAKKEMNAKYSFLLLITFEGAIRLQEWASLKKIIQAILTLLALIAGVKHCTCLVTRIRMYGRYSTLWGWRYSRRRQIGNDAGFSHLARFIAGPAESNHGCTRTHKTTHLTLGKSGNSIIIATFRFYDWRTHAAAYADAQGWPSTWYWGALDRCYILEQSTWTSGVSSQEYSHIRAGDQASCNTWCQHAISVSRFVGDEGSLEKTVSPLVILTVRCKMDTMTYWQGEPDNDFSLF